jgi:hypothetical protein
LRARYNTSGVVGGLSAHSNAIPNYMSLSGKVVFNQLSVERCSGDHSGRRSTHGA